MNQISARKALRKARESAMAQGVTNSDEIAELGYKYLEKSNYRSAIEELVKMGARVEGDHMVIPCARAARGGAITKLLPTLLKGTGKLFGFALGIGVIIDILADPTYASFNDEIVCRTGEPPPLPVAKFKSCEDAIAALMMSRMEMTDVEIKREQCWIPLFHSIQANNLSWEMRQLRSIEWNAKDYIKSFCKLNILSAEGVAPSETILEEAIPLINTFPDYVEREEGNKSLKFVEAYLAKPLKEGQKFRVKCEVAGCKPNPCVEQPPVEPLSPPPPMGIVPQLGAADPLTPAPSSGY